MVEVPSAALLAHRMLEVVDFLSIGTNDLTQYTMAADRMATDLAHLTDAWQPAVLQLIAITAEAGKQVGKPVGVCGEAAADPLLACVLVGMGITSLSMASAAVRPVGARLAAASMDALEDAAEAALSASDPTSARDECRSRRGRPAPVTSAPEGPLARAVITRRGLLVGGSAGVAVGVGVGSVVGWEMAPPSVRSDVRRALGRGPEIYVPDAPEGQVRLEQVTSQHLGATDLFTAVPAGHGAGAGLPVIVVLHGASSSVAAFREYGLARFVTAAVQAGAPPFVLAGTDDGPDGWVPSAGVDPQAMLREELPGWLEDRGFAADRRALWGWSRGGYGALRYVQVAPDWARGLALFSPGLLPGNPALDDLSPLATLPWDSGAARATRATTEQSRSPSRRRSRPTRGCRALGRTRRRTGTTTPWR